MKNFGRIKNWCQAATDSIRYPPDRKKVFEELYAHALDHYDDLVAQGLAPDAAEQLAVEAMGKASDIAPQLAAIHRPFWGYLYSLSKVLLVTVLAAVLLSGWYYHQNNSIAEVDSQVYTQTRSQSTYQTNQRLFYSEPIQTHSSDGYTFTLTNAALWRHTVFDEASTYTYDTLHFRIRVTSFLPWAPGCDGLEWMWAVDDLGNYYYSSQEAIHNLEQGLFCWGQQTGLFTWIYDFNTITYVSQDVRWIELHYDRSGRDLVFRIDLTGGEAA